MKVKLDLDDKQLSKIVTTDLKLMVSVLKQDLAKVKKNKKGFVFDLDFKKDVALINAKINAFNEVLEYYGVPEKS